MKKISLLEAWDKYMKNSGGAASNDIAIQIEAQKEVVNKPENWLSMVAALKEALIFWEFLRHQLRDLLYNNDFDWDVWRFSLVDFIHSENSFIALIAKIEYLPTSVWRKILWRYNINFASLDCFFRRLTPEQAEAIKVNFQDFKAGQTPRVFNWWDKKIKRVTYESLQYEPISMTDIFFKRYKKKGSMSYNLLGLDFGFNAYPKGKEDDTKIIEISPFRFLSEKEHADDFVVNKEGGKYFTMYKWARSNYIYRPKREVNLKTHICPGFWYTLLIHFLFWIISPLCAIFCAERFMEHGLYFPITYLVPLAIGCFTTLWVLLAAIKLLFVLLGKFLVWLFKVVISWIKNSNSVIFVIPVSLSSVLLYISTLFSGLAWDFTVDSTIRTILVSSMVVIYLVYKTTISITSDDIKFQTITSAFPNGVKLILKIFFTLYLFSFVAEYPVEIFGFLFWLGSVIVNCLIGFWEWLVISFPIAFWWLINGCIEIGNWIIFSLLPDAWSVVLTTLEVIGLFFASFSLMAVIMVLCMVFPFALIWLLEKFNQWKKSDEVIRFMIKYGYWTLNVLAIISAITLLVFIFYPQSTADILKTRDSVGVVVFFMVMLVIISGIATMAKYSLYKYDKDYKGLVLSMEGNNRFRNKYNIFKSWRAARKNQVLTKSPEAIRQKIVEGIYSLFFDNFIFFGYTKENMRSYFQVFLSTIHDDKVITDIKAMLKADRGLLISQLEQITNAYKLGYFLILAQKPKMNVYKAIKSTLKLIDKEKEIKTKLANKRSAQARIRLDKLKKFFRIVYQPAGWCLKIIATFVMFIYRIVAFIFRIIAWLLKKIWYIVRALYGLWELFQKRCPYVEKSESLF